MKAQEALEKAEKLIFSEFHTHKVIDFSQYNILKNVYNGYQQTKFTTDGACFAFVSLMAKYLLKYISANESFNTFRFFTVSNTGVYYLTYWMKEHNELIQEILKLKDLGLNAPPRNGYFNKYYDYNEIEMKSTSLDEIEEDQNIYNEYRDSFFVAKYLEVKSIEPNALDLTCLKGITNYNKRWNLESHYYTTEYNIAIIDKIIECINNNLFTNNTSTKSNYNNVNYHFMQFVLPHHIICLWYFKDSAGINYVFIFDPNIGIFKYVLKINASSLRELLYAFYNLYQLNSKIGNSSICNYIISDVNEKPVNNPMFIISQNQAKKSKATFASKFRNIWKCR